MAVVSDNLVVIVGPTEGSYGRTFYGNDGNYSDDVIDSEAVVVMLNTSFSGRSELTTTPTPTSAQESRELIISVAVGSFAALLIASITSFFYLRRRRRRVQRSKSEGQLVATNGTVPIATDQFVNSNHSSEGQIGTSNRVRITSSGRIKHVRTPEAEVVQNDRYHPDGEQPSSTHSYRAVFPKHESGPALGSSSTSTSSVGETATNNYELKPVLGSDRTHLVRQGGKRSFGDPPGDHQTASQQFDTISGTPFNLKMQATMPVCPTGTPVMGASVEDHTGGRSRGDRPGSSESALRDGSEILESSGAQSLRVEAIARSMLAAVERLIEHSSVPGVSEAATLLSMFARLVLDNKDTAPASERRLRWCS